MSFLKNTVIAVTGTLPHSTKEIQGWVARNGGHYLPTITKDVTHLLASKEAYKSRDEAVKKATSLGMQILSYDWFEDSLQARRKLGTTRYQWQVLRKERRVSKQLKRSGPQADALNFRKGCKEIQDLTGTGTCDSVSRRKPQKSRSFFFSSSATDVPDTPFVSAKEDLLRRRAERATAQEETKGTSPPSSSPRTQAKITHWKDAYHYYRDVTGFEYKVCLLRSDFSCNGVAKYYIGLLESHAKPHVYWSIVHYQPAKKSVSTPAASDDDNGNNNHINENTHPSASAPIPTPPNPAQDNDKATSEATRLTSLITPSPPNPHAPYTGEICPRTSAFNTALHTFRYAFQDLTLIAWEDRFSPRASATQLVHAQHLNYEPFVYCKPKLGMPVGLFPQAKGLFGLGSDSNSSSSSSSGGSGTGRNDEGYVRGGLGFPVFERGLDGNGRVGAVVVRERERLRVKRKEEEREEKIKKKMMMGAREWGMG